ncbi:MAG: ABC transporter permease subunit [Alphaproteobacteria bacterium]|nr:ABC transporter permease subunit [Alphaproteobacteria bacterium]
MTAAAASAFARPRRSWGRFLPLLPVLVFLGFLFLYPVGQLLWLSVVEKGSGDLTAAHYARLLAVPVYSKVLLITFETSAWCTLFCVLGGYPVAYLLATTGDKWRNNLMLLVLLPFWTSFLVRTFAWIVLLGRNGAINKWLQALGITDAPLGLIYNFAGVMVGMTHALMPLAIISMVSVMENIDANLPRAASTLGARGGQAFFRIYFPLSLPGVAAGGLLTFITAIGFFITPALLGGRQQIMITQVIIEQVQDLMNWSFGGAVSMLLLVSALFVFWLYDRALGMSTLAGGSPASQVGDRGTWLSRGFAWVGDLATAAIGRACDLAAVAWETVFPQRPDKPPVKIARGVLWATALSVVAFLAVPTFFIIPVSFTTEGFIQWPPKFFSWRWYDTVFESPTWIAAIVRSLTVATLSAGVAMLIGTPAAFFLSRQSMIGKTAMLGVILSPLIIPRIIIAVALFYFYAKLGLIGTNLGLILGHAVLAVPYVVVTVMAVLKNYDERLDQAASSLGANRWRTLWHVTFPLIRAGLIAAFIFAFVTSLDELTIALFVSGGLVTTLPKQMWDDALLKVSPTLAAVSTLLLIFVTFMILAAEYLRRRAVHK